MSSINKTLQILIEHNDLTPAEVAQLRLSDLHLAAKNPSISFTPANQQEPKVVTLDTETQRTLVDWLVNRPDSTGDFLFPGERDKPMSLEAIESLVQEAESAPPLEINKQNRATREGLRNLERQANRQVESDSPPDSPRQARSVPPEFAERMRQRRPGYDRVYELVLKYEDIPPEDRAKMSEGEVARSFVTPLFEALGWEVGPFMTEGRNEAREDILDLVHRELHIPVEIKKFEDSLGGYTIQSGERWGVLTNFETIYIFYFRKPDRDEVLLQTSPRLYIADGNDRHDVLAAEIFYERLVQQQSEPSLSGSSKLGNPPVAQAVSQRIEPSGIPSAEALGEPQIISVSDQATISEQVNVAISPPSSVTTRLEIAIRALADKPSDVDLLGFKDYAEALTDFIKEPKTEKPLTIGIDAAWGMGKTTLMRMIRQRLEGQPNEIILNSSPIEQWPFRDVAKEMSIVILKTVWRSIKVVIISPWSLIKFIAKIIRTTLIMIWVFLIRIILHRSIETGQKQNVRESFPTVWFNAWKYDEEESLWAALVLEILNQVRQQLTWRQQTWLNLKLNWKRFDWALLRQKVIKYLAVYIFLVGILGTLTFGIASLWLGATWQESWQKLSEYIQLVGGLGFLTAIYAAGKQVFDSLTSPFDLKLEQYLRQPNYAEKVGFLAQFEADFKRVVDVVTENGKWPLVVFIDDLDRCAPPKPVEIIEAINLMLDSQHCVFILGMDAQTVAGSIEAKYKDLLANLAEADAPGSLTLGQRFLEKIIQINFRIPQVKPEVMVAFIEANLVPLIEKPASTPTQAKVAEAENLIKAEQRAGTTSVEAAAQAVQSARPDLPPEVMIAAKQEVQAKSFDDSEEVKQAIRTAVPYLGFNPRKVKRFINLFRLQALIANRRGLLDKQVIQIGLLSKWLLLASLWPDVVEAIVNDSNFINRLKQAHHTREELQERHSEVAPESAAELETRNMWIQNTEARLNSFLADPLIKQLFATPELFDLLADLDTTSPVAFSQYLHLAQMGVDSSARQQPVQSEVKQE